MAQKSLFKNKKNPSQKATAVNRHGKVAKTKKGMLAAKSVTCLADAFCLQQQLTSLLHPQATWQHLPRERTYSKLTVTTRYIYNRFCHQGLWKTAFTCTNIGLQALTTAINKRNEKAAVGQAAQAGGRLKSVSSIPSA